MSRGCVAALAAFATVGITAALPRARVRNQASSDPLIVSRADNLSLAFELPFESHRSGSISDGSVQIKCGKKKVSVPRAGILLEHDGKKALWCPNAKVGTSTIFNVIDTLLNGEHVNAGSARTHGQKTSVYSLLSSGQQHELCDVDFSFIFLRNPWDRVRSAYLDKINRIISVPDIKHASFDQFLQAVHESKPNLMNVHWQPISTRCLTAGRAKYNYTKVFKIEDNFEKSVTDAFAEIGIPRSQTMRVLSKVGERNVNHEVRHTLAERRKAFQNKFSKDIINSVYKDDIAFGRYSFEKAS